MNGRRTKMLQKTFHAWCSEKRIDPTPRAWRRYKKIYNKLSREE